MNQLVKYLIKLGVLITPVIIDAFLRVDRGDFVLLQYQDLEYEDIALPIGHGQTISQPQTVAFMIELLLPQKGDRILDVGSGSGWTTAILSQIVGKKGKVVGVEIIPDLVTFGNNNLNKNSYPQAKIVESKGKIGYKEEAPYDRILVSASSPDLPNALVDQLKPGGKMVIPIGESIWEIKKEESGKISKREFPGFVFVPLI